MNEFDALVEQQDQEIIQTGTLSEATVAQLAAMVSGKAVNHVDYQSVTKWLKERRWRRLQDDDWWDEEGDGE